MDRRVRMRKRRQPVEGWLCATRLRLLVSPQVMIPCRRDKQGESCNPDHMASFVSLSAHCSVSFSLSLPQPRETSKGKERPQQATKGNGATTTNNKQWEDRPQPQAITTGSVATPTICHHSSHSPYLVRPHSRSPLHHL